MFKRILSFALASTMALSIAATAMAATTVNNPVAGIEATGYAYDSDNSAVNLNIANPTFSYGDTIYYPLLNSKGTGSNAEVENAQNALTNANTALNSAKEALVLAKTAADTKVTALNDAKAKLEKAQAVVDAANAWKTAVDNSAADIAEKQAAYEGTFAAYDSVGTPAVDADSAVLGADAFVVTETGAVATAQSEKDAADADVVSKEADVKAKEADVKTKQDELNAVLKSNSKYVHESEAVKSIKVKQDWSLNGKAVEGAEIQKKKATLSSGLEQNYIYFLSVKLKDSDSVKQTDISGVISLRKSGDFDYEDVNVNVDLTVGYPVASDSVITEDIQIFSEGNGFSSDAEDELRFEADDNSFFTVNTIGQGKLLLAMDCKFDSEIAARFPTANLDFFNGNGASFNKIGVLTLSADKDSFIYRVNKDNSLTKVNAEYDEYEEAYTIRTRTLDRFVISDVELKNTGSVDNGSDNGSNGGVSNPNTGAAL